MKKDNNIWHSFYSYPHLFISSSPYHHNQSSFQFFDADNLHFNTLTKQPRMFYLKFDLKDIFILKKYLNYNQNSMSCIF